MQAKRRATGARVWILVVMVAVVWSFAWGCPPNTVGPGDGGDGSASEGSKSDGVGESKAETAPEPGKEAAPEIRAELQPEPTKEPVAEPPKENAPEPRAEPTPEPTLDVTSDAGSETVPESTTEPGPEPTTEPGPDPTSDQPPKTPEIGDPCKTDADCGGSLVCVPEGKPASFPFPQSTGNGPPGGYCTARCYAGGGTPPCPQGSECYVPGAASGTCLKICKADTDCRSAEGYHCTNDGGMQSKACFPPTCSLTQPGGNYWMNITNSSTQGTCSQQPMAAGSRIPVSISISAGEITFQFGSKPQSPLPVTWSLIGAYSTTSSIVAANPKGCSQSCDGLLKTNISNPCLFYGSLNSRVDANCTHVYDASFTKRP